MKKGEPDPPRRSPPPKKRKPIMRHSREGVRSRKAKRTAKPKKQTKKTKRTAKPRAAARKAKPAKKAPAKPARLRRGSTERSLDLPPYAHGMGARSGGQSGDIEALSSLEDVDSESVEELLEEGQAFEAGVISGVEEADEEFGEVRTREVPVDDVPQEYLDED